jgi:L-lactate dehydrogenase complex protein LldG
VKREVFLSRVREAAAAGRAYRVHPSPTRPKPLAGSAPDDPIARMAREVEASGGHSHVVNDPAGVREILSNLLTQTEARSALCWKHPLLERIGLRELLEERGVELCDYDALAPLTFDEQRTKMLAADIGITGTTWAIAETGTLAVASGPGSERLASLAPRLHVAVIEASQILPTLFDLFARYGGDSGHPLPTNLTLITGPSKTGDIELELTTGVHGPAHWHVIILRD